MFVVGSSIIAQTYLANLGTSSTSRAKLILWASFAMHSFQMNTSGFDHATRNPDYKLLRYPQVAFWISLTLSFDHPKVVIPMSSLCLSLWLYLWWFWTLQPSGWWNVRISTLTTWWTRPESTVTSHSRVPHIGRVGWTLRRRGLPNPCMVGLDASKQLWYQDQACVLHK